MVIDISNASQQTWDSVSRLTAVRLQLQSDNITEAHNVICFGKCIIL